MNHTYQAHNVSQMMIPQAQFIDSREIAEMTEKQHKHLLRDIDGYSEILENSSQPNFGLTDFFIETSYMDAQSKTRRCYLCTRKGCEMIANKMTGEKGVLFTAAYINRFHEMEQAFPNMNVLSPELRTLINLELKQNEQAKMLHSITDEIQGIRDVVTLDPSKDWRHETNALIKKIAEASGGFGRTQLIRSEIYKVLEQRFQINLNTRLRHKVERMQQSGVSRSKCAEVKKLDVIAEESKLIHAYISIVKEFAIKYNAV